MQHLPLHANWRDYIKDNELQRLNVIEDRIERKKRSLSEATTERQKLMSRAIRRMRRAQGKT